MTGVDEVEQKDRVMLTSVTQKYKLSKGYKHKIKELKSSGNTYKLNKDFRLDTRKDGSSYIVWIFPELPGNGIGSGGYWFPSSSNFQDKSLYPNGNLDVDTFWSFEPEADTVNFINDGLDARYTTTGEFPGPPFTRTEYANNMRFGRSDIPPSLSFFPPVTLTTTVRPAKRTGTLTAQESGFGLFCGDGMILYGTPCDFIGIGGYGPGVVDGCPAPAGTGGALTQSNTYEGEARIYKGSPGDGTYSHIKAFRVTSVLDGNPISITNVVNVGGNVRVTTGVNHGYSVDDIVYMLSGTGCYITGPGGGSTNLIWMDKEGFRITATPANDTFEIDANDAASWTFGAPWPTVQKITSSTATYWDSGDIFPDTDIKLTAKQSGKTEEGEDAEYQFYYNITGTEEGWKKIGPKMDEPLGYPGSGCSKIILGSYTGGHFNLSGSIGTFNSSKTTDGTQVPVSYRKLESECVYYTKGPDWPADTPEYTPIPIFDEEDSA